MDRPWFIVGLQRASSERRAEVANSPFVVDVGGRGALFVLEDKLDRSASSFDNGRGAIDPDRLFLALQTQLN